MFNPGRKIWIVITIARGEAASFSAAQTLRNVDIRIRMVCFLLQSRATLLRISSRSVCSSRVTSPYRQPLLPQRDPAAVAQRISGGYLIATSASGTPPLRNATSRDSQLCDSHWMASAASHRLAMKLSYGTPCRECPSFFSTSTRYATLAIAQLELLHQYT